MTGIGDTKIKMTGIEERKHERIQVLFCRGAVVSGYGDDMGGQVMNNIMIKDISLGGIGFTADSSRPYEKQKTYELKLRADVPWNEPELSLKIVIIRTLSSDEGGCGRRSYGAVYRNLSDEQLTALKKIVSYQQGVDAAIKKIPKKTAVI
ncbi:hypothetical protein AGMMS49975_25160 [Clostridia bacterium]|nr:hypothetical protein AGMMS49975_25160 [Clostridia bacterium]